MDVREKLVELLNGIIDGGSKWHSYSYESGERLNNDEIASHLIAHGVTVQEWTSIKDRLPEHGGVVLCFMKFGEQRILQWNNVSKWWLGYGHGDDWQKADVTHWMRLPDAPEVKK